MEVINFVQILNAGFLPMELNGHSLFTSVKLFIYTSPYLQVRDHSVRFDHHELSRETILFPRYHHPFCWSCSVWNKQECWPILCDILDIVSQYGLVAVLSESYCVDAT